MRFTRALFGLARSPFLLGGVTAHHLKSWEALKPELVVEIRRSLYVDDHLSGKPTVKEAQQFKEEAIEVFQDATFKLHKWHSNAAELEEGVTTETSEKTFANEQLGTPHGGGSSLLGLAWEQCADEISVSIPPEQVLPTKREILRKLAKIYDPLGLVSPLTLQGKFIYREACNTKLAWDFQLPGELGSKWTRWEKELPERVTTITKFREEIEAVELHACGDASAKGVSAVVHAIVTQRSGITRGLVAGKARLAKQGFTTPRLSSSAYGH